MNRPCLSSLFLFLTVSLSVAEPITSERIKSLPADQQPLWTTYFDRSKASAKHDEEMLQAEVKANNLAAALPTPDGGDFKLPKVSDDTYYTTDEAKTLADVILSYQAPCGGWSKHTGYSKGPRKPGSLFSSQYKPGGKPHYLCTFDNRSTTEQLHFLANIYQATKREDCKTAFLKGLDFVLQTQNPNGGWPQVYPLEGGYHDDITFNDDAMTHVLELLQAISTSQPQFGFVDDATRQKATDALKTGLDCVMKMQVVQDGTKTVWCAQHDSITLLPTTARSFEIASLSGGESAKILAYLMTNPNPSPEVIAAIESGISWFEKNKVTGISKVTVEGKTTYELNPNSAEVYWARFNDLKTSKPIFPGRDGVAYSTYEEMAGGKNVGYDYYITAPGSIITTGQKKWRKLIEKSAK